MTSSFRFSLYYPFFLLLILHCTTTTTTLAQTAAPAPASPGPANVTKILENAGEFTTLVRLFAITHVADQINSQLKNSDQGVTLFAPTDNAFSNLKAGFLNFITDQQKSQLLLFHVIPTFISTSQFKTVTNPLKTQAGDSNSNEFPLNITSSGEDVSVSTGVVDTTVGDTIYTDGSLAVYQVDKVLMPMNMSSYTSLSPAPAPEADKTKKKKSGTVDDTPTSDGGGSAGGDASGAVSFGRHLHGLIVGSIAFIGVVCL